MKNIAKSLAFIPHVKEKPFEGFKEKDFSYSFNAYLLNTYVQRNILNPTEITLNEKESHSPQGAYVLSSGKGRIKTKQVIKYICVCSRSVVSDSF